MTYLLFLVYLVVFCWLVTKTRFFFTSGLNKVQLVILFTLKIAVGIFYGWMGLTYGDYAHMRDTWAFHRESMIELDILYTDPGAYFANIVRNPYENGLANFFGSENSYWNNLKANSFIKLLSVFNIFSFGKYAVNIIFFSYLSFFGPVAFYKVMRHVFPDKKWLMVIGCFLIPSFLYWTSGIHKDGLVFTAIALIIYHTYFGLLQPKMGAKRWAGISLGFFMLLLLRNFYLAAVLPALMAWMLSKRYPLKRKVIFTGVYGVSILLFFTLKYVSPVLDLPKSVAEKQAAFSKLTGSTSIQTHQLSPDIGGFIKNFPQALSVALLRPHPGDIQHLPLLMACTETAFIILLLVLFFFFRVRNRHTNSSNLMLFCFAFSLTILLQIGYTVNNLGAIVRYRSLILPLLLVFVIAQTDWNKITRLVLKK